MDITVILDDLAAGRIDAAEAKRRISALGVGTPDPTRPPEISIEWPAPPPPKDAANVVEPSFGPGDATPPKADKINGVSKVLVRATGRKVKIVADPLVSTAAAEDVHQVKRNGAVLEVVGDKEFTGVIDAFSWVKSVRGMDDVKALGIGKELTVRVNPILEVDVDLTGSSLTMTDVPHIGKIRLTAGVATIAGARRIADLLLQAGQVAVAGRFTDGWSRVRCESGQITVAIARESDVVVRADAQLGRVTWEGRDPVDNEVVLGLGTAHLDVGVVVGHGTIHIES